MRTMPKEPFNEKLEIQFSISDGGEIVEVVWFDRYEGKLIRTEAYVKVKP